MVVDTHDRDIASEARVAGEVGRNEHAALLVDLGHGCAREHEALHLARLPRERVERADALGARLPARAWIDVDGAVDPADENDAATESVAELRRQGEAVLVVDRVLVGSVEHRLVMGWCLPRGPTLLHFPTAQPPRPTHLSECLAPKMRLIRTDRLTARRSV